jgi:hypothetical protein
MGHSRLAPGIALGQGGYRLGGVANFAHEIAGAHAVIVHHDGGPQGLYKLHKLHIVNLAGDEHQPDRGLLQQFVVLRLVHELAGQHHFQDICPR